MTTLKNKTLFQQKQIKGGGPSEMLSHSLLVTRRDECPINFHLVSDSTTMGLKYDFNIVD